jgi:hypothetical protein
MPERILWLVDEYVMKERTSGTAGADHLTRVPTPTTVGRAVPA